MYDVETKVVVMRNEGSLVQGFESRLKRQCFSGVDLGGKGEGCTVETGGAVVSRMIEEMAR